MKSIYYKKSCGGKHKYKSKNEAEFSLFNAKVYRSGFCVTYKCKFCDGWHIGHVNNIKYVELLREDKI